MHVHCIHRKTEISPVMTGTNIPSELYMGSPAQTGTCCLTFGIVLSHYSTLYNLEAPFVSVQVVLWPSRGREEGRKKEYKNRVTGGKCEGVAERLLHW